MRLCYNQVAKLMRFKRTYCRTCPRLTLSEPIAVGLLLFTKNRINTQLLHIVLDIPCLEHNRQGTFFFLSRVFKFCEQKTDRKQSPLTAKSACTIADKEIKD